MSDEQQYDPELAAAAALGAVTDAEREAFLAGILSDPSTYAEFGAYTETAVELGLSVAPIEPSEQVSRSILDLIASTPQEPRPADAGGLVTAAAPAESISADAPGLSPADVAALRLSTGTHRVPRRRRRGILVTVTAAIVAAAAAIAGIVAVQANRGPTDYERIAQASDVQRDTTDLTGGGTIAATWSHDAGLSAIQLQDAPELTASQTYELWYVTSDGAAHAAGLVPTDDGSWVTLDGELEPGATIAITVEPKSGSEQPTTTPLAAIATA